MAFTSIGYDGTVNERQWAELVPSVGSSIYGIKEADDLKVSAVPGQPLMVSIAAGTAWGHGVMDTETLNTTVTCDAITSGTRWDLIALRRNWQPLAGGPTSVVKVTGTAEKVIPGSREAMPGVTDDQPLALVQWTAGQTQPTAIVDLRVWASNGGLFAKDDLVRTYIKAVGTQISINGALWACRLGDNDLVVWEKAAEIDRTTVPAPDGGWSIAGGIVRINSQGFSQCRATLKITRVSGPSDNINQGYNSLLDATIPAAFRPTVEVQGHAVMSTVGGNFRANLECLIGTNGDIAFRVESGVIALAVNDVFYIDMGWWQ
jgi:hypothetical protein